MIMISSVQPLCLELKLRGVVVSGFCCHLLTKAELWSFFQGWPVGIGQYNVTKRDFEGFRFPFCFPRSRVNLQLMLFRCTFLKCERLPKGRLDSGVAIMVCPVNVLLEPPLNGIGVK